MKTQFIDYFLDEFIYFDGVRDVINDEGGELPHKLFGNDKKEYYLQMFNNINMNKKKLGRLNKKK
jgi:hypothetical protein